MLKGLVRLLAVNHDIVFEKDTRPVRRHDLEHMVNRRSASESLRTGTYTFNTSVDEHVFRFVPVW